MPSHSDKRIRRLSKTRKVKRNNSLLRNRHQIATHHKDKPVIVRWLPHGGR